LIDEVKEEADFESEVMERLTTERMEKANELNEEVKEIVRGLRQGQKEVSDAKLESMMLEITAVMYDLNDELTYLGSQSDIGKAKKNEKYNEAISEVSGTIPEKEAQAEDIVKTEQSMEDMFKRVYKECKNKLDSLRSSYSAIKKIYSKRMKELEVFREEFKGQRGR